MRKPNLFIVGTPKSGTTALYNFLKQHPQVFMTPAKEPFYFSTEAPKRKVFSLDDYLQLFKDAENEKIIGEASTNYIYFESALEGICEFNPDAKIIIMLREPVDFLYSFYHHTLRNGKQCQNFDDWLEQQRQKSSDKLLPERIKYEKYVQRWISFFGSEQVKVVIYEDFKSDNVFWYQNVLKFLGVDASFVPEFNQHNQAKQPRFKYINRFLKQSKVTGYLRKVIPYRIWNKFTTLIDKKLLLKEEKSKPIDHHRELQLKRKYKPEVEKISKLLDIDLVEKWGYNKINLKE